MWRPSCLCADQLFPHDLEQALLLSLSSGFFDFQDGHALLSGTQVLTLPHQFLDVLLIVDGYVAWAGLRPADHLRAV